jgi:hypothetical protein
MDHKYIHEFDLVERYLIGRLGTEEASRFEEHFVDCPECVDHLKYTKALMEGLRIEGVSGAQSPYDAVLKTSRSRRAGVLAIAAGLVLLVAFAGLIVMFTQLRRARTEADQAKNAATEWQRRYDEEHQSQANAEAGYVGKERELSQQVDDLKTELEDVKKRGSEDGAEINVPMFVLTTTRGGDARPGSTNELRVPSSAASFIVLLPLEGETSYRQFRVSIADSRKQPVWSARGIRPTADNSIVVLLKSTRVRPGHYLLTLEGVAADGVAKPLGEYSFRIYNAG